jgi:Carboxypeptidase regulatory-like domain/TonB-dependent Receptor Plug Domain
LGAQNPVRLHPIKGGTWRVATFLSWESFGCCILFRFFFFCWLVAQTKQENAPITGIRSANGNPSARMKIHCRLRRLMQIKRTRFALTLSQKFWSRGAFLSLLAVALFLVGLPATAFAVPETQDQRGQVVDSDGNGISGAACTLSGTLLTTGSLQVTTDNKGMFSLQGLIPGKYTLTCAAVGFEPYEDSNLQITSEEPPFLLVTLPNAIVVHQHVEVREKAPVLSRENTAPPARVTSTQLRSLPLTQQKFQAALPLVPGVLRTPDGRISIKGTSENQGLLLVNGAESVDPVTGSFSIDIPIDAVQSITVQKTAYKAEYGRFSGGLTELITKPPSNIWHYELNDFVPSPRVKSGHVIGIADDKPRLSFSGPLKTDKVTFSESFTYDLLKQPVRGLAYPHNETKVEGFTSFSTLQLFISDKHLLSTDVNIFPLRKEFADINSLVPQSASSNYNQKGYSLDFTDRYMFTGGGVLTSMGKFTEFKSNAYAQGPLDMIITPNGWGGNFFNSWQRSSSQDELRESYLLHRREWRGHHQIKIGASYVRRDYDGLSTSHPVRLERADGTLAGLITFSGPGSLGALDTEVATYAEDHWEFNDRVAVDYGMRFSSQTLGEKAQISPRFGIAYSPDTKTVLRSGIGAFYDRVPLLAGNFTHNPVRTVQLYDANGLPEGPPITYQNAYERVSEDGTIVPTGTHLDSTPYNITWSLEADREIRPDIVARVSYVSSRTYDEFILNPLPLRSSGPTLLMNNTGGSRYYELESTLRYHPSEKVDVNFSYVHSLARGDLNTLGSIYVPFEQPVIRPNFFASLPSNVPDRVVTWGRFQFPRELTISPLLDVHTGFPYSALDDLQNYVGSPNSRRFPTFASLDLQINKNFSVNLTPWLRKHKFEISVQVYNLTNTTNPRDVYNVIDSPYFGHFVGLQHRFYDVMLDIIY